MGLQRAGHHVGRIGVSAVVGGGADAALGIGLQHHACQVRNGGVKLIEFGFPPLRDARVQGIEGVKASDSLGAAEIHGDDGLNAPGAESGGDGGDLREKFRAIRRGGRRSRC